MKKCNRFMILAMAATMTFGPIAQNAGMIASAHAQEISQEEVLSVSEALAYTLQEQSSLVDLGTEQDTASVDNEQASMTNTENEGVNTEETKDADDNTEDSKEETNTEDKTEEDAAKDYEVVTDQEVKEADKAVKEEKKKAEEEAKKTQEEAINYAKEEAGKIIQKAIDGKYEGSNEVVVDIAKSAVKIANKYIVKNIPYVGDIANGLINGALEEEKEDKTVAKLSEISGKLDTLNSTVKDCTTKITNQQTQIVQDGKINAMNAACDLLLGSLKDNKTYFDSAMKTYADLDHASAEDIEKAEEALEDIYSPGKYGNKEMLKQYIDYFKKAMNIGNQTSSYSALNPTVFSAFKQVKTDGKDGKYAISEFADQRTKLVSSVKGLAKYGYDMLNTAIEVNLKKQEALKESYDKAMKQLETEMKNSKDNESLQTVYNELKTKREECKNTITNLNQDKDDLKGVKDVADEYIKNEEASMKKDEEAFKSYKPGQNVNYFFKDYTAQLVKGKQGYPTLNTKDNTIEYRDAYGTLLGKRKVETSLKKVNQYAVKEGETYTFEKTYLQSASDFFDVSTLSKDVDARDTVGKFFVPTRDVKVTEVFEKEKVIASFGFFDIKKTVRTIRGTDIKTGKEVEIEIGGVGNWDAYEKSVSEVEEC